MANSSSLFRLTRPDRKHKIRHPSPEQQLAEDAPAVLSYGANLAIEDGILRLDIICSRSAQVTKSSKLMAVAADEFTRAVVNVCQRSESIMLQLVKPFWIIEGLFCAGQEYRGDEGQSFRHRANCTR
jgi:hypothetical protein